MKKIALVHYWLLDWRGGEKVLKDVTDFYVNDRVTIYTNVFNKDLQKNFGKHVKIKTTFIQKLPMSNRFYQAYLLLMPLALFLLKLDKYDLIISFESGPAKGIKKKYRNKHISYVHSPMRYIWDMHDDYIKAASFFEKIYLKIVTPILRVWDKKTAHHPKVIYCNSNFVKKRITKYWGRESSVIYPGTPQIDVKNEIIDKNYYLFIGELNHYKKADLVFNAFLENEKKLKIIGKGKYLDYFKKSKNENIEVLGRVSDFKKDKLLAECSALIFPGVEDFGLVPVEAMNYGKPVIAFRSGGALETVEENLSGVFFNKQTVLSLNEAINKYEFNKNSFSIEKIQNHAKKFSVKNFKKTFSEVVVTNI